MFLTTFTIQKDLKHSYACALYTNKTDNINIKNTTKEIDMPVIHENMSLKAFNTLSVEAFAKYFVRIKTPHQLKKILLDPEFKKFEKLVIGDGSNILFVTNFEGIIIKMEIPDIEKINETQKHVLIKVGAGINWHSLVEYCIKNNYYGIENLSLIPGTVGAAPVQNIGAYGAEVKDVMHSLEAMEIATGDIVTFKNNDCKFKYRDSIFKNALKDKYIILNVSFKFRKNKAFNLKYLELKNALQNIDNYNIKDVSNIIKSIRQNKLPDYKIIANAGSFFKNPEVNYEFFNTLKTKFPYIKGYRLKNGKVKIPAALLIEKAGWKGIKIGNVGIYNKHALVLINYNNAATGREIHDFAKKIILAVKAKFHIKLIPEVRIVMHQNDQPTLG